MSDSLKTATDETIHIRYNSISDTSMEISVRVGLLGDRDKSQRLMEKIKERL